MHTANMLRNALTLGLITAIGPFAVDMYLPALPAIGEGMGAPNGTVVLSLTSFFIAFGLFQILFGTLADMLGRKLPLYGGIILFIAAGIGCALTTDIETLIALRFLQGVGGAAGIIVPRAIMRDLYSGVDEVRMMSLLMLVFSVSPLLAPLAGSFIIDAWGWRAVFWTISAVGALGLALLAFGVKETLPPEKRIKVSLSSMMAAYRILFADRAFMGMVFLSAFSITAFFIYLGTSAFVMSDHYGLSAREYSIAFSVNALAFFATAQANGWLSKKFGMARVMIPAATCFAAVLSALAILFWLGFGSLTLMCIMLFVGFSFVGVLMPTAMVLSLENHGDIAGTAASLMNTAHLLIGALAMAVGGAVIKGSPTAMLSAMAISATLCLAFTVWTFKKRA